MKTNRLQGLDALRGIAATSVMLFHYLGIYGEAFHGKPVPTLAGFGFLGVPLFFMISGYVIFLTLDRTTDWREFAVSRFARLYPAFLVAMPLTASTILLSDLPLDRPTPSEIAVNLTMIPRLLGAGQVDGSYWTLGAELIFYVLAAVLVFGIGKKHTELVCCALLSADVWLAHRLSTPYTIIPYGYLFVVGMMAYRIQDKGFSIPIALTVLVAIANGILTNDNWVRPISMLVPVVLLAWGIRHAKLSAPMAPLIWLGEVSYSLYLIHGHIGFVVIYQLEGLGISSAFAISVAILTALSLAILINRTVERPAQRAIVGLYRNRRVTTLETATG